MTSSSASQPFGVFGSFTAVVDCRFFATCRASSRGYTPGNKVAFPSSHVTSKVVLTPEPEIAAFCM